MGRYTHPTMEEAMIVLYGLVGILFSIYSWGFVDPNMPFVRVAPLVHLVFEQKQLSTFLYIGFLGIVWVLYARMLALTRAKKLSEKKFWILFAVVITSFFLAFSALSNDIFNYIATARVTYHYHENPYLVMPIEIPNEPMLAFLHAANKVALYGPVWIALTFVPHVVGFGSLLLTFFAFKAWIVVWFIIFLLGLKRLAKNNLYPLVFVAFNPLVILETLTSAHNDVVMMALTVWAYVFLSQKKSPLAYLFLLASVLIKGATIVLLPMFLWASINQRKKKTTEWQHIYSWSFWLMLGVFFLSPLREEMYPWYYLWPLTFASLLPIGSLPQFLSFGFTLGLPLRYIPFTLTRDWGVTAPTIKKVVTAIPALASMLLYAIGKSW